MIKIGRRSRKMIILILIGVSALESEATHRAFIRKESFELCWKLYPELGNSFVIACYVFCSGCPFFSRSEQIACEGRSQPLILL